MNIIVRDADNVIVMYSPDGSPEPGDGCRLVSLDDAQTEAFNAAMSVPNSGIIFDGTTFTTLPPPVPPAPLTPEQKLAASGLTVDELKTLLGLK